MTPRIRNAADPRHCLFRTLLEAYWRDEANELVPDLPWSAGDAGALAAFLRANPRLSADGFRRLLENRLASEDHAAGEPPKTWLGSLTRYAGGPLDRFKLPKRAEAKVGMARAHESPEELRRRDPERFAQEYPHWKEDASR